MPPQLPDGQRVYAIGDVHGEGRLLTELVRRIAADAALRGPAHTTIVLLGDVIDRGPDAANLLLALADMADPGFVLLRGNHEQALIDAYRGDDAALQFWLNYGGGSTLAGLGVPQHDLAAHDPFAIIDALRARLDVGVIEWLEGLPTSLTLGDYFFTHAGVRPGIALDRQNERDLLWIREPFLSSKRWHGKVIVHGHTIEPGTPMLGGNRIGIDTGAHEHGTLTALGLEADRQWLLQASSDRGGG